MHLRAHEEPGQAILLEMFFRGLSTHLSTQANSKHIESQDPTKRSREGKRAEKNQIRPKLEVDLDTDMISLLPRLKRSILTHRQWFHSLICEISHHSVQISSYKIVN
jgi:hypothetical protein